MPCDILWRRLRDGLLMKFDFESTLRLRHLAIDNWRDTKYSARHSCLLVLHAQKRREIYFEAFDEYDNA